jgi:hypothetical protein
LGNDDATDTAYAGTTPPRARKERVAVVIPTFLEAESIAAVVAALPRDIVDRVVVVDGAAPTAQRKWRVGRARKSSPSAEAMGAPARRAASG